MKGSLANKGRCPKCTLKPPCKHFESVEQLNSESGLPTQSSVFSPTQGMQLTESYSGHENYKAKLKLE